MAATAARDAMALAAVRLSTALDALGLVEDVEGFEALSADVQFLVHILVLGRQRSTRTTHCTHELQSTRELAPGALVICTGLSKTSLNGCIGRVIAWTGERYKLQVEQPGAPDASVSVRPSNLRAAHPHNRCASGEAAGEAADDAADDAADETADEAANEAANESSYAIPPVVVSAAEAELPCKRLGLEVELQRRSGRGRCAVASTALRAGTPLGGCGGPPYAACLLPVHQSQRCDHCLQAAVDGKPMLPCNLRPGESDGAPSTPACGSYYCSPRCRAEAADRHSELCRHLSDTRSPLGCLRAESCTGPRADASADRYVILMLALRCLWRRRGDGGEGSSVCSGESGGEAQGGIEGGGGVRASCREMDEAGPSGRMFDCLERSQPTAMEAELTALATRLPGLLPPGAHAADLEDVLCRLRCNTFRFCDETGGRLGAACYPQASMFNHSCAPNCVVTYSGAGVMRVRVACDVTAGAELTHCYVDLCAPTVERAERLRQQYGFSCTCRRCAGGLWLYAGTDAGSDAGSDVEGGGDVDVLMRAVRVGDDPADDGAPSGVDGGKAAAGGGGWRVVSHSDVATARASDAAARALSASTAALARVAATSDLGEAMRLVTQVAHARRRYCHPLSLWRYQAERAMCAVALERGAQGDDQTALDCGRCVITFLETALQHTPWHPTLAVERMQQAGSEAARGHRDAAVRLMAASVTALEVTHGTDHPLTERARVVSEVFSRTANIKKAAQVARKWTVAVSRVAGVPDI